MSDIKELKNLLGKIRLGIGNLNQRVLQQRGHNQASEKSFKKLKYDIVEIEILFEKFKALEAKLEEAPTFYVARDKNNSLYGFTVVAPLRNNTIWALCHAQSIRFILPRKFFPEITWESEPQQVALIKR